jgi:hypothetical protein
MPSQWGKKKTNPKHKIRNPKQYQTINDQKSKQNEFWYLNLEFWICLEFRN